MKTTATALRTVSPARRATGGAPTSAGARTLPPPLPDEDLAGEREDERNVLGRAQEWISGFSDAMRARAMEALMFTSADEKRAYIATLAQTFVSGMLMTFDERGTPRARPVTVAEVEREGDELTIWFVTGSDSRKSAELGQDDRANITFQDGARYLSIFGRGDIVADRAKLDALRRPALRMWFERPGAAPMLLRVRARAAEYWDRSGLQGLRVAFYTARSLLSGAKGALLYELDDKQHGRLVFA